MKNVFFVPTPVYRTVSWCISDRPRVAGMEISEFLPWASNMTLIVETRNA